MGKLVKIFFRKCHFIAVKINNGHVFFFCIFLRIKYRRDFANISVEHIVFRLIDKLQNFISRSVDNISELQFSPFFFRRIQDVLQHHVQFIDACFPSVHRGENLYVLCRIAFFQCIGDNLFDYFFYLRATAANKGTVLRRGSQIVRQQSIFHLVGKLND
ncbi:hypothetical protein BN2127_JRS1_06157 [Bacillus cereus]|nr:hypothetical protein BN2127_JRS1_06157 [Bacillus cereus]